MEGWLALLCVEDKHSEIARGAKTFGSAHIYSVIITLCYSRRSSWQNISENTNNDWRETEEKAEDGYLSLRQDVLRSCIFTLTYYYCVSDRCHITHTIVHRTYWGTCWGRGEEQGSHSHVISLWAISSCPLRVELPITAATCHFPGGAPSKHLPLVLTVCGHSIEIAFNSHDWTGRPQWIWCFEIDRPHIISEVIVKAHWPSSAVVVCGFRLVLT